MMTTDRLADAALAHDALRLRALVQELLRADCRFNTILPPESDDPRVHAVAAGIIELLAERASQPPPPWCSDAGRLDEPFYLLESAGRMPRLRAQCEAEAPAPLRKRNLFAPADFLTFA